MLADVLCQAIVLLVLGIRPSRKIQSIPKHAIVGYDIHIVRDPSDYDRHPITAEEWQRYIDADSDLRRPEIGKSYYSDGLALLPSAPGDPEGWPWLSWSGGTIYAKYPQEDTLKKMLQIAKYFEAQVVGDEGEIYVLDKQGKITVANQTAAESFSAEPGEVASSTHPPPIPVALPPSASKKKGNGCLKGCMLVGVGVIALLLAGVLAIYLMAREYEKRPKSPGEAELVAAEDFILAYEGSEASGNTPEAITFAKDYARDLRISRQMLFTEGKEGSVSLTKGYFLTYCFEGEDSLAIVVHVPELRHYANDAKVSLGEYAWTLAVPKVRSQFPHVKRLAVGLKGMLDYSTIFEGHVIADGDPLEGIQKRHTPASSEALWQFFKPALKK